MAETSTRRKRQPRGVATHARVLEAGEELFIRRGYESAKMAEVAQLAGISVGTLYHYFPDKHALLLEIVDLYCQRVARARRKGLDLDELFGDEPRSGIRAWLREGYERLRKEPSLYLVVLGLAERDPEVRRRYEGVEQLEIERLRTVIELGQQRGLIREQLDPAAAAFLIHHAIDMAVVQLLVREVRETDPDRVLSELTDMICRYALEEPTE